MRTTLALLAFFPMMSPSASPGATPVEVGSSFGLTLAFPSNGGTPEFAVSAPSGTAFGLASFYATILLREHTMIEPQVFFHYGSAAEEVLFSGMLQVGRLFDPVSSRALYLTGGGGFITLGDGVSSPALGVAVGNRFKVGDSAAFRIEARYRYYTDTSWDFHEFGLGFALGAVLR